jgi:hypothetical protein
MRILFRDVSDSMKLTYPIDDAERNDCQSNWNKAIEGFQEMIDDGKEESRNKDKINMIKYLSKAFYPIDPTMHFMIIDKKIAFFGFYEPRIDKIGAEAGFCYVIKPRTEHGYQFIYSLEDFFERNWSNYEAENSLLMAQKLKNENKLDEALRECDLALSRVPLWKQANLLKNEILNEIQNAPPDSDYSRP